MDVARQGFAFFEELFDLPYPFAKYDQLFVPEFNAGAMENAGAVTITEHYVFRSKVPQAMVERRGLTILHELAHMWFGDLVTMRWWDDLWLNESFAEYASTRCQAEATRWRTAWTTFSSAEKAWAYRQDQLATTHPVVADIRDLEDVEVNFDGITYAKGASVLKQLVHWVGTDAFDEGLRRYFRRHAWGNTDAARPARRAGGDERPRPGRVGPAVAAAGRASTRCARTSRSTPTAPSPRSPCCRRRPRSTRCCARTGSPSAGTTSSTAGSAAWPGSSSTSPAPPPTVPELVGARRPALLLVNDDDLAYAKIRLDEASLSDRRRAPARLRRDPAALAGPLGAPGT